MVEVTLRGRPGHGSVPKAADNALVRAAEAIRRISAYEAPTVITQGAVIPMPPNNEIVCTLSSIGIISLM